MNSCTDMCAIIAGKDSVLTWERRVKILRDCALAIRFLHHYIDGCIVHRDIKVFTVFIMLFIGCLVIHFICAVLMVVLHLSNLRMLMTILTIYSS